MTVGNFGFRSDGAGFSVNNDHADVLGAVSDPVNIATLENGSTIEVSDHSAGTSSVHSRILTRDGFPVEGRFDIRVAMSTPGGGRPNGINLQFGGDTDEAIPERAAMRAGSGRM